MRGAYTLIISMSKPSTVDMGRLGRRELQEGTYLYTGSGMGRGSSSLFGRIGRHIKRRKRIFWHIDYILASRRASIEDIIWAEARHKAECRLNRVTRSRLGATMIPGVGSSDCKCQSHFAYVGKKTDLDFLTKKICSSYQKLGLKPTAMRVHMTGLDKESRVIG